MNETRVSSISTDWSIQSISIKPDIPIFIDLSIDKSIVIFIYWLLRAYVNILTIHVHLYAEKVVITELFQIVINLGKINTFLLPLHFIPSFLLFCRRFS